MAEVRPYVSMRTGIAKTKAQFDPQLFIVNPVGGNVNMHLTNSGKAKKNSLDLELAMGLTIPIAYEFKIDAEVIYDPLNYKAQRNLSYSGFFPNFVGIPGHYETRNSVENMKMSQNFGINVGLRYTLNKCHEVLGRVGIQHSRLSYQSALYNQGNLRAKNVENKKLYRYSTELGWIYHWSKSLSSEMIFGYQFKAKNKTYDLHPSQDVDYFPRVKVRQILIKYGIRYNL
ncbi:MAG: hypothetical protein CMM87_01140 [Rickettsiales bacterium]|nr:hypothetical protein [Rickettsiales bacterium]